jgi:hypothetical protein
MRGRTHLSDDRLVEVCLVAPTASEAAHLGGCEHCTARRSRLERLLRDIADAAAHEADAVFPPEKLATQQARILQRIEQDGRPARVITFPAAGAPEAAPLLRTRPTRRWVAAAAAAGLAIGLLAGHLAHDFPAFGRPSAVRPAPTRSAATTVPPAALRTVATISDEQFLGEMETVLAGPSLAVLRPLDDLTPR